MRDLPTFSNTTMVLMVSIAQANLTLRDHSHTHKVLHSKSFIKFFR